MFGSMRMSRDDVFVFGTAEKKVEATGQGVMDNGLLTPMASMGRRTPSPKPAGGPRRKTAAELSARSMHRHGFDRSSSDGMHDMQPNVAHETDGEL